MKPPKFYSLRLYFNYYSTRWIMYWAYLLEGTIGVLSFGILDARSMTDKAIDLFINADVPPRLLKTIGEVPCKCTCGWEGTVYDYEPDVDGDGNLGCPECNKII